MMWNEKGNDFEMVKAAFSVFTLIKAKCKRLRRNQFNLLKEFTNFIPLLCMQISVWAEKNKTEIECACDQPKIDRHGGN